MTEREQLLQEITQAPDEWIQILLAMLHHLQHFSPLASPFILNPQPKSPIPHPVHHSLAEALCLIPDVGDDSDFERIQDESAPDVFA
ncbi:MAG: hypothetical protein VKK80_00950 [Prochlorothrix sp.]|nr:hypothetical protein [Prochlorothrix sp.]